MTCLVDRTAQLVLMAKRTSVKFPTGMNIIRSGSPKCRISQEYGVAGGDGGKAMVVRVF